MSKQMHLPEIEAVESKYLLRTYERNPVHFVAGEGVYLIDENGERYLDLLSGIGVNALGYAHRAIEDAIAEQSRKLLHTSNLFFHSGQAALAERLAAATGLDRVFFANSGTEAWEAALKVARAHARKSAQTGRPLGRRFLALEHSFHGRTMGALATTHKLRYREPFAPLMGDVDFIPFDAVAELRARWSPEYCALCIEAIQGEGGIRPVSEEFMRTARALTAETGALLIVDEIQAGLGRTGRFCAYQHYGILPDVATLAKPLGGGLPLGAMLCSEAAGSGIEPGLHGSTFGGGPLACSVAVAVLQTMESDGLLAHVAQVGAYFKRRLEALASHHDAVVEVRGLGLMLALEVESAELAKQMVAAMLERRIIINRTSETVLRFLPPYILEQEHVDAAVAALSEVITQLAAPAAAHSAGEVRLGH